MTVENHVTAVTDLNGLAQLRSRVAEQDPRAVTEAAHQFEALFLQMMLKSMRSAGAAFAEERDRSYEEMFDQQIALELAQKDAIGVADLLMRQIGMQDSGAVEGVAADARQGVHAPLAAAHSTRVRDDFKPTTPREFVNAIWPHARSAGAKLGIDPRAIVAQAALETGWGEKMIRDANGVSGNNLFGIKSGEAWRGDQIAVQTLEYEAGAFVPRREQFRAYATLAEGFADYVSFLSGGVRYREAVVNGSDASAFGAELQAAGYATDPRYGEKIRDIVTGARLSEYLGEIDAGETRS